MRTGDDDPILLPLWVATAQWERETDITSGVRGTAVSPCVGPGERITRVILVTSVRRHARSGRPGPVADNPHSHSLTPDRFRNRQGRHNDRAALFVSRLSSVRGFQCGQLSLWFLSPFPPSLSLRLRHPRKLKSSSTRSTVRFIRTTPRAERRLRPHECASTRQIESTSFENRRGLNEIRTSSLGYSALRSRPRLHRPKPSFSELSQCPH